MWQTVERVREGMGAHGLTHVTLDLDCGEEDYGGDDDEYDGSGVRVWMGGVKMMGGMKMMGGVNRMCGAKDGQGDEGGGGDEEEGDVM